MITDDDSSRDKLSQVLSKGNPSLEITTFGGLSIRRDGQPVPSLHSRKAQALLVYLALTDRSQPREVLANFLWEEFSQKRAMNNLRVVLSNLRKHLGNYLLITRDTAGMNPAVDYDLDVAELDTHLDFAGEYERKTGTLDRDAVGRIEQAVELYKGEFLEGFFIENALEFDAWMVVERERLHHIVLDGFGKLVRWELGQGEYTTGIRHASKRLQLDPLSDTAHRQMMRLLVFSGQRSAALSQYEKCREILASELGVEPDTRTTTFYEQIRDGSLSTDAAVSKQIHHPVTGRPEVRRHNLPVQTTPFIGRENELVDLNQLLIDPSVRLVTVLGTGGMGKTRLALEVGAGLLDQFSDGVFFVSLAQLRSAELVAPSIVQALGLEFALEDPDVVESTKVLKEQLLDNLRSKNLLLILDNFEHILGGVALVGDILRIATEVKVLATSRVRLNVSGEHRFLIAGMDIPTGETMMDAQKSSAIRLYLQSAQRALPSFALNQDELVHITGICRLVEGMPLGIHLAAAWVEMLSTEEIAAEIAQSIDLLETDLRDIPERHRSIRALFDHSWNLLSPREREVFQGFSVFQGGCTRGAAQEITGATLRILRSLVDQSLLHRTLNGRYEIHELSREYANDKLREAPDAGTAVHSRHSAYYTAMMQAMGEELKSDRQASAMVEMDQEIENARAAWNWAVKHHQAALLDQSIEGLRYYYAIRRRKQEAERTFRFAAVGIKPTTAKDALRVYARLLCMQGYFSDGNEKKKDLYQQSLTMLKKLDEEDKDTRHEKALVLNFMGQFAFTFDFDEAMRLYEQSLKLFHDLSDNYWKAEVLYGIGLVYMRKGDLDEGQKNYERSLIISQELGDPRRIALTLGMLDFIARKRGKFEEAERLARQALAIYKTIGDNLAIADGNGRLGVALFILGKHQEALTHLKEASIVHEELDDIENYLADTFEICWIKIDLGWYAEAWDEVQSAMDECREKVGEASEAFTTGKALSVQGAASLALGRLTEAEHLLQESITAFQKTYTRTLSVHPYSSLGILYIVLGQPDRAREYLRSALKLGVEINSAMAQIYTLTGVALILAKWGNLKHAVEIHALVMRYPWIANSQWNQDIIVRPLTTLTASLSPETIAAAQKRGRARNLEETVQELVVEFC